MSSIETYHNLIQASIPIYCLNNDHQRYSASIAIQGIHQSLDRYSNFLNLNNQVYSLLHNKRFYENPTRIPIIRIIHIVSILISENCTKPSRFFFSIHNSFSLLRKPYGTDNINCQSNESYPKNKTYKPNRPLLIISLTKT